MKPRTYDFSTRLRKGPKHTKREIIDSLKDFARERRSNEFAQRQYDTWKRRILCAAQIAERFGGWAKAMEAAGLDPKWSPAKDPIEMIEVFKDCWEEHDDAPTEKVFINYLKRIDSKLTINMYKHHFGGLRRLAQRVADFHAGRISENQLAEKHASAGPTRRPISPKLRYDVFVRDSFSCVLCGRNAKLHGVQLEVDHKKAVANGGTNDMDNLQTLCFECNRGKLDGEHVN